MTGDLDDVEEVRRRLAPIDPVGALVLGALVRGDDSILDQAAHEWLARAVANDDTGDEALSSLARLVELLPRGTTALAAFGSALAGRGHRTEAREIAKRLRQIAGDGHVPHFNAAGSSRPPAIWPRRMPSTSMPCSPQRHRTIAPMPRPGSAGSLRRPITPPT